jgi:hypothetical protein
VPAVTVTAFPRTEAAVDAEEEVGGAVPDDVDEEASDDEADDVGELDLGGTTAEDLVVLSERRGQIGSLAKWLPSHT